MEYGQAQQLLVYAKAQAMFMHSMLALQLAAVRLQLEDTTADPDLKSNVNDMLATAMDVAQRYSQQLGS